MKTWLHTSPRFPVFMALLFLGVLAARGVPPAAPALLLSLVHPEGDPAWNPTDALAIRVELAHPADQNDTAPSDSLTLAPVGRAWPETVTLRVTGPGGQEVSLPWIRSGTRSVEPLIINVGSSPAMAFILQSDLQRTVPPGSYSLVATLEINDATQTGINWTGRVESAPLTLVVAGESAQPVLEISVAGHSALAVGDPWVVTMGLPPPLETFSDNALRSGYELRVFDSLGREQAFTFEPAVTVPILPGADDLRKLGLFPVIAVLPPTVTSNLPPGEYRIEGSWTGPAGLARAGSRIITVRSLENVQALADRAQAALAQRLGWATALLWRAEFGTTTEIENLSRQAAPLLLSAERIAFDLFWNNPALVGGILGLSETFFLQGDYEGALAFMEAGLGLWSPPADSDPSTPNDELLGLTEFHRVVEQRSTNAPSRVLPYLRPAIAALRPPDFSTQWAVSARASSEYRPTDYSAAQATGEPNVTRHGDNARAWATRLADAGEEWIELTYASPVRAGGVRVIQSFNPGAIVRIEVLSESGVITPVWTGPDRTVYPSGEIGTLSVNFPPPSEPVNKVKIILDTKSVAGWNEIDAVQLLEAVLPAAPRITFTLGANGSRFLEFPSWPSGFVLQHATTLSPPDWANYATVPAARFEMGAKSGFFRLRSDP